MKIAHRQGHSVNCTGASDIIDEVKEASKVNLALDKYLKLGGVDTVDCTSNENNKNSDLKYGVDKANKAKADYYIPIHFNCAGADSRTDKERGVEVLICGTGGQAEVLAKRILNKLVGLGFKNRGVKIDKEYLGYSLYDLKYSNMPAILIEVCFVDSQGDVNLYNKLGADLVGKSIAEGILGKIISSKCPTCGK